MEYTTSYYVKESLEKHSGNGLMLIQLTGGRLPICLAGWGDGDLLKAITDAFYRCDLKQFMSAPDKWFDEILAEYRAEYIGLEYESLIFIAVGRDFLLWGRCGHAFALNDFFGKGNADLVDMESGVIHGRMEGGAGILLLDAVREETQVLHGDSMEMSENIKEYKSIIAESLFIKKRLTEERAEKHLKELADYSGMCVRRAVLIFAEEPAEVSCSMG